MSQREGKFFNDSLSLSSSIALENSNFTYASVPKAVIPKKKYRDTNNQLSFSNESKHQSLSDVNSKSRGIFHDQNEKAIPYYKFHYNCYTNEDFNLKSILVENSESLKSTGFVDEISQTDTFKEAMKELPYIPKKVGVDVSTQLHDELFDFNVEVGPVINTMIAKVIEQSIIEVNYEEQLSFLESKAEKSRNVLDIEKYMRQNEEKKIIDEIYSCNQILMSQKNTRERILKLRYFVAGKEMMRQLFPLMIDHIFENLILNRDWIMEDEVYVSNSYLPQIYYDFKCHSITNEAATILVDGMLYLIRVYDFYYCFIVHFHRIIN